MDMKLVSALIDKVNASGLKSLEIEENGLRIRLENAYPAMGRQQLEIPAEPAVSSAAALPPEQAEPAEDSAGIVTITAPLVGIFYPLEECGKAALTPGEKIKAGQVVCAIEAMKLINDVESTASGEFLELLVKAGEQVEFGQPLMKIREGA